MTHKGRKGMRGGSAPRADVRATFMVRARVTPAEAARLGALAGREGVSVSEMIRRLIEREYAAVSRRGARAIASDNAAT